VPEVFFAPLQLPLAVHDVALVELQVSAVLPPDVTEVGDAVKVRVGAGVTTGAATATFTVLLTVPPAPVQVRVSA